MAFQTAQVPFKLTPEDMGRFDLMKSLAGGQELYKNLVANAYLPRMQEAEIFNKQFSPLAQLAVSPLTLAMLPDQQKQMADIISKMLQNYGGRQISGNGQSVNEGSFISRLLGRGNSVSPQQPPQIYGQQGNIDAGVPQSNGNAPALLPQANRSLGEKAATTALAPYQVSPTKPGQLGQNPATGEVTSHPTESTISLLQQQAIAIKSLEPVLKKLAKESIPFLSEGGTLKKWGGIASGELSKLGAPKTISHILGNEEYANQYAQFKSSQANAIDKTMKALNLPNDEAAIDTVRSIIEPQLGETEKGYTERVSKQLYEVADKYNQNISTLGGGLQITPPTGQNAMPAENKSARPTQQQIPRDWVLMRDKEGKMQAVHPEDVKKAESMGWSQNMSRNVKGYS